MQNINGDPVSASVLLAYGLLILLYLLILRLLLNLLQQMTNKHYTAKSVIDRDIHRVMNDNVETSMHAFNVYSLATLIVKAGVTTIAMAAIVVLLVVKVGIFATTLLVLICLILLWTLNQWLRRREKAGGLRQEIRKYTQRAGSAGTVVLLSIALVVLLFVMIVIH